MNIADLSLLILKKRLVLKGLHENTIYIKNSVIDYYDNNLHKPILILLNGFGANAEIQWRKIAVSLSSNYRILIVNLLNFGKSKPEKVHQCSVDDQVAMLHSLFEHLKIQKATIAGISYGGLIASEFTESYSGKVDKLLLVDVPTKYLDHQKLTNYLQKNGVASAEAFFVPTDHTMLKKQLELTYYKSSWIPDFVLHAFYKKLCKPYLSGWHFIVDDLLKKQDSLKEKTYTFKNNTTIIWGKNDQLIPLEVGLKLKDHLQHTSLHVISNCGHVPIMEKPKECISIIRESLSKT